MGKHLQSGSLKTINGEVIEGSGNIVIGGSGDVGSIERITQMVPEMTLALMHTTL